MVMSALPISEAKLKEFKKETSKDTILQCLQKQIKAGWPNSGNLVDPIIVCYFSNRHELTHQDGLILKGNRIVAPSSMRKELLTILHQGHQGIEAIKNRARYAIYWPNINGQLEDVVKKCDVCQEHQRHYSAEPLMKHEIPQEPWSKVGTDLFSIGGKDYIIIVDYMSKYFDVTELTDQTAMSAITHTKVIFSKFGIPKEVISDNGPCYNSKEYAKFAKSWDFKHTTSSPGYPCSNGMVERTIQTVKRTIKKCIKNHEDINLALLTLRATNRKGFKSSPGEIMMNRNFRTPLPFLKVYSKEKTNEICENNGIQCKRMNLKQLNIGDTVRMYDGRTLSKFGKVIEFNKNPRSYMVKK